MSFIVLSKLLLNLPAVAVLKFIHSSTRVHGKVHVAMVVDAQWKMLSSLQDSESPLLSSKVLFRRTVSPSHPLSSKGSMCMACVHYARVRKYIFKKMLKNRKLAALRMTYM